MSGISSEDIRQLVREALREILPADKTKAEAQGTLLARLRAALLEPKPARVEVRVESGTDLVAFARDILQAPEDVRRAILSGKIELVLPRERSAGASLVRQTRQHQISKGVVTEVMVTEIGKTSNRLIIGKGVVVTPLARDKAREVKLEIVRDRT